MHLGEVEAGVGRKAAILSSLSGWVMKWRLQVVDVCKAEVHVLPSRWADAAECAHFRSCCARCACAGTGASASRHLVVSRALQLVSRGAHRHVPILSPHGESRACIHDVLLAPLPSVLPSSTASPFLASLSSVFLADK